jgi:puromycin-sensitive aminopeptidase
LPSYRLPRTVEPLHYELTLTPDLAACTFAGEQNVRVTVHEPVDEIVLNAIELDITTAELVSPAGERLAGTVSYDEAEQQARIALDGQAAPGEWTLSTTFSGTINDKLRGFYRSTFTDDDGETRVIATTQFEATDARRAFPCWDEPDLKATFGITLIVDSDLTALSNASEIETVDLGDGRKQVRFADTMRMSTYLVAFVVGPLALTDPVDVDGVPLRIACLPGKENLTAFALEAGAHSLRFFTEWFGLPYPGDKLDMVALPDFAFGAMENLCCVTFRESLLVIDPTSASRVELERVADVVAHEIAHMWFGDLVTMKWWNGLWLNEAFATFMELLCVDAFRPDWQRWTSFSTGRGAAMLTDGLQATRPIEFPVGRPEEAEGMFDVLTYQKGAAVLRMLERYLGAERFRAGIGHYLKKHSYGNAETTDLWDAIEESTGEPVRSTMDSWILQGGYPLVSVSQQGDDLVLEQRQFSYSGADSDQRWSVPVMLRAEGNEPVRTLLTDAKVKITLPKPAGWVVVNDGGWGFFRVAYSSELLGQLTAHLDELDAIERYNLVSDTWAATLAGAVPVADFVDLARLYGDEDDPSVWSALLASLAQLHRMAPEGARPGIEALVRDLTRPALDRVGWERSSSDGERTGTLRAALFGALGLTGKDPDAIARARELHGVAIEGGDVDPDLAGVVNAIVARNGGEAEYTAFLDKWRKPSTPQEENRYLYGLADFEAEGLVRRTLDLSITEVRTQNAPFLLNAMFSNRKGGRMAWDFVKDHWDEILGKLSNNLVPRMLDGLSNLSEPDVAADIKDFLASHPTPSGEKLIEQMLERLAINVAFRTREAGPLAELFGDQSS